MMVGVLEQLIICGQGFPLNPVQSCTGQVSGAHGGGQGGVVYQTAPGGVDEDGSGLHALQLLRPDHVPGGVQKRHMEGDDVRGAQQLSQNGEKCGEQFAQCGGIHASFHLLCNMW